ncbi:P-loop containing nucleoside triphosphate hydrolase protein [Globomyces pollinis-pini]|nr:P-loop containing nucleoside triphosphate hydrolase protein [Globomyces pollinis-pini]
MLYYVGYTDRIGNVDDGSTVTDYLKVERERGITVQSACIPLSWNSHRINLIDTPGHVDFTIEVERSLRVLDGAITILDGVSGVEAQTETVWRQSNNYKIPRIIYVNKMDRPGAAFGKTLQSIQKRLIGWGKPLVTQLPIFQTINGDMSSKDLSEGNFEGVVDVLRLERLDWKADAKNGGIITKHPLTDGILFDQALKAREELIENLSDIDEEIVEAFMEADGDHLKISAIDIEKALRRCTLNGSGVPVLCGASFKNIGVQPLLDSVIKYLPSPKDVPDAVAIDSKGVEFPVKITDGKLCALAFKVIYDAQKGPLVFVRVYSGKLESRSMVRIGTTKETKKGKSEKKVVKERATKLLEIYADDYEEIPFIQAGNIGVVVGFKNIKTGDSLVMANDARYFQLDTITIPPPVFVRSCHVESAADEKLLAIALDNLLKEDPSLSVSVNEETGQTLLSGMGELHLEIAGERLMEVYKVKCKLGKVEISYRESVTPETLSTFTLDYDREILGKQIKVAITLELSKSEKEMDIFADVDKEHIVQGSNPSIKQLVGGTYPELEDIQQAIRDGIQNGLSRGPKLGYPVSQVSVKCKQVKLYSPVLSTIAGLRTAAHLCVQTLLKQSETQLLQPMMDMKIYVPPQYVGNVSRDLSGTRRGIVNGIEIIDDRTCIDCTVPLSQLVGYASVLRSMTQGNGEWTMELNGYQAVNQDQEAGVMKSIRGY